MTIELTENNFVIYALKHYDNPSCGGIREFEDDLKRFRYLIRLFRKYEAGKGLKERLILNHLVVVYNLFGVEAATRMLFFKIEKQYWSQLKSFLTFLHVMPIGIVITSQGCTVNGYEISADDEVITLLSTI
jgi:hypothetical protein